MKYVLNLADDGHILSASFHNEFSPTDAILVDELPEGNVSDYRFTDGECVYDPIPAEEPAEPKASNEERITELEEALAMLLSGVTE